MEDARVDLVGGVSPDHMLDGFVAARVVLHPRIDLEDMLMQDDNGPAVCYELLDLARGHDGVLPGRCPTLGGVHGGRRVGIVESIRVGQARAGCGRVIEAGGSRSTLKRGCDRVVSGLGRLAAVN